MTVQLRTLSPLINNAKEFIFVHYISCLVTDIINDKTENILGHFVN